MLLETIFVDSHSKNFKALSFIKKIMGVIKRYSKIEQHLARHLVY